MTIRKYLELFKAKIYLIFKALHLVFGVSRLQTTLLVITIILQGTIPAFSIKLSAELIEYLTNSAKEDPNKLFVNLVLWGSILLAYEILTPIILV